MSQKSLNRLPRMALLAFVLLISVFVTACSKNTNTTNSANATNSATTGNANRTSTTSSPSTGLSPTDTVKAYYEAAYRKDVEAVKRYISQGSLKLMEDMAKAQGKTFDEMVKASREAQVTPEFTNETVTGDTATVDINVPSQPMVKMPLVKEGGQWKLALDKLLSDVMRDMPNRGGTNTNSDEEDEDDHGKH